MKQLIIAIKVNLPPDIFGQAEIVRAMEPHWTNLTEAFTAAGAEAQVNIETRQSRSKPAAAPVVRKKLGRPRKVPAPSPSTPVIRKLGRPRKAIADGPVKVRRPIGRPRKTPLPVMMAAQ